MGELGVLFNPGMRHEREEKLAKQMLREDEGTGRKGRLRIDLESGVVVIGSDGDAHPDSGEPSNSQNTAPEREEPTSSAESDRPTGKASPAEVVGPARRSASAVPSGKARRRQRHLDG